MTEDNVGRRIFQTWKSKASLPENYRYWRSTIVGKNPDFAFTLWDDADNRAFIAGNFPWFLNTYDGFPAEIFRVDCVRYFYLYLKGGFYIDLDTECLSPLDKFADHPGILLGRMGLYPEFPHAIPNAIMASRPREEFWLLLIGLISNMFSSGMRANPEIQTGPVMLKSAVDIYLSGEPLIARQIIRGYAQRLPAERQPRAGRSEIKLLPQREWFPIDWSDPIHRVLRKDILAGAFLKEELKRNLFPQSSLVTYWTHAWEA